MRKFLWCVSFLGFFSVKPFYIVRQKSPQPKRDMVHTASDAVVWCVCVYIFELSICAEEICVFALDECHYSKRWGTNRIASMLLATPLAHFRSLARSIYRFLCLIVAQIGWKSSCPVAMPQAITIYVYMYETEESSRFLSISFGFWFSLYAKCLHKHSIVRFVS